MQISKFKPKKGSIAERLTILKGHHSLRSLVEWLSSKDIQVSINTLHKWLHGGKVSERYLEPLARAFGMTAAELAGKDVWENEHQLSEDAIFVARCYLHIPEKFQVTIKNEVARLAQAFDDGDKNNGDVAFRILLHAKLNELRKRA